MMTNSLESSIIIQVDRLRHNEMYTIGDEVALSIRNIGANRHIPFKLWRYWIGPY